jgi:hypothetical protein
MKPSFHIANPASLRPRGHGQVACDLLRGECARKDFFHHD